jgi:hypothetical protein
MYRTIAIVSRGESLVFDFVVWWVVSGLVPTAGMKDVCCVLPAQMIQSNHIGEVLSLLYIVDVSNPRATCWCSQSLPGGEVGE